MRIEVRSPEDLEELTISLHGCWIDIERVERVNGCVRIPLSERATRRARASEFTRELILCPVSGLVVKDTERVGYYDLERFVLNERDMKLRIECNIPVSIELGLAALPVIFELKRLS